MAARSFVRATPEDAHPAAHDKEANASWKMRLFAGCPCWCG